MSYGVMKRHGGSLDARCVVKASALKWLCGLLDPRAGSACRDKIPGQPQWSGWTGAQVHRCSTTEI